MLYSMLYNVLCYKVNNSIYQYIMISAVYDVKCI